jgi:hypothetical protein
VLDLGQPVEDIAGSINKFSCAPNGGLVIGNVDESGPAARQTQGVPESSHSEE